MTDTTRKRFRFHAKNRNGDYEDGEIESLSQNHALDQLDAKGLSVISISEIKQTSPQDAPPQATPPKPPAISKALANKLLYGFIVCAFILSVLFLAGIVRDGSKQARLTYHIVRVKPSGPNDFRRKDITIKVPRGARSKFIKTVSQKIYDDVKKNNPVMEEAQLFFFSENQDVDVHNPIAVLRWNWEGYGAWEYNFSFQHEQDADKKVIFKQKQYKRDKFVVYEFTLPSNVSIDSSMTVAKDQLEALAPQWEKKVKTIKVDVHYEGYTRNLMTCEYDFSGEGAQCALKSKK